MARESIGTLHIKFKADVKSFRTAIGGVRKTLGLVERSTKSGARSWVGYAKGILGAVAAFKALQFGMRAVRASFETAIQFERQGAAIEALAGDVNAARKLMDDIQQFALATPFTFFELLESSKQLLAFGFSLEQILPTLAVVGKAAAATGQSMADTVFPLAQSASEWKLTWKDIRQFLSRGILSLNDVAKAAGVARDQVKFLTESGRLTFPIMAQAMKNNAMEGGRFAKSITALSDTVFGLTQRFKDLFQLIKRDIGFAIFEAFNLKTIMEDIFKSISSVVSLGQFKAAMVEIVTTFRDTALFIAGAIEQIIRSNIRAFGIAAQMFGGVLAQLDKALAFLPGFGGNLAEARKLFVQEEGESRQSFEARVFKEAARLKSRGELVRTGPAQLREVDDIGGMSTARRLTREIVFRTRSELALAADAVKSFGKDMEQTTAAPTIAMQLERWLNPDGLGVVGQSLGQFFDGLSDRFIAFKKNVAFLAGGGTLGIVARKVATFARSVQTGIGGFGFPFLIAEAGAKLAGGFTKASKIKFIQADKDRFIDALVGQFDRQGAITVGNKKGRKFGTPGLADPFLFGNAGSSSFFGISVAPKVDKTNALLANQLDTSRKALQEQQAATRSLENIVDHVERFIQRAFEPTVTIGGRVN